MPWKIKKVGSRFKVVNAETGRVKGTHTSKAAAQRQIRALHANVKEK